MCPIAQTGAPPVLKNLVSQGGFPGFRSYLASPQANG